ncbi:HAMP domain-containing sensor histidine kinase [Zobellella aerophila]|uniref:histidine kinase n=1 Tax=Zobellella aerophila TaxID=870480 RepID=A0ABP6V1M3_9GAMM
MINFRRPIRQRLLLALNLVIVASSTLFAVGMVLLIVWFEDTLFYNHLQSDLADHIRSYQSVGEPLVLPMTDTTYYKLPLDDLSRLPSSFRDYPVGAHEVLLSDHAYNLFVRHEGRWAHILVQDQSEFERYELMVFAGVVFGIVLVWTGGYWLSRRLSRQILMPVSRLAEEVVRFQLQSGEAPRLGGQYPDDEVGLLANTLEHYAMRVHELLVREQQFTANASHELRTPMMVIQGAVDMLRETGRGTAAEQRQLVRIEGALKDMQQQISLFLQLSRTPDSLSQSDTMTSLSAVVERQISHWQPLARQRGLSLTMVAEGHADAQVPATMMAAILNNLLRNAINHTAEGGILVEFNGRWLAVNDTGSGIPPEALAQVLARGVSLRPGGSSSFGLGLAIVQRICEHQGWTITIAPNHPAGTRVSIHF